MGRKIEMEKLSLKVHEALCLVLSSAALGIRDKIKGMVASLLLLALVKDVDAKSRQKYKDKPRKLPIWCRMPVSIFMIY